MINLKAKLLLRMIIAGAPLFSGMAFSSEIEKELDFVAIEGRLPQSTDLLLLKLNVCSCYLLPPSGSLNEQANFMEELERQLFQESEVTSPPVAVASFAADLIKNHSNGQDSNTSQEMQEFEDRIEREDAILWQRKVRRFQAELAQKGYNLSFKQISKSIKENKKEEFYFSKVRAACKSLHRASETRRLMDDNIQKFIWRAIEPLINQMYPVPLLEQEKVLERIKHAFTLENLKEICTKLHTAESARTTLSPAHLSLWEKVSNLLYCEGVPSTKDQWRRVIDKLIAAFPHEDQGSLAEKLFELPGTSYEKNILTTLAIECLNNSVKQKNIRSKRPTQAVLKKKAPNKRTKHI
jgi:hypothetical protein